MNTKKIEIKLYNYMVVMLLWMLGLFSKQTGPKLQKTRKNL